MGCCASKPAAAEGTPAGAPPVARAQSETPTETKAAQKEMEKDEAASDMSKVECCGSEPAATAAAEGTPADAPSVALAQKEVSIEIPSNTPTETPTETVYTDNQFRELGERIEHTKGAQAAVRLLKASYLIELHRSNKKLVRRQDLPEDAFYTGRLDHVNFRLFAISCKARATSNPLTPMLR